MDTRFSGVVKLSDVSDFISASQDCVVANSAPSQPQQLSSQEAVKISLQDCLACSGCVTSAETALLENQSSDEFLRKVADDDVTVALSVSSEATAALSVAFDLSPLHLTEALIDFFRCLGVDWIFDLKDAEDLTLVAAAQEFLERFRSAQADNNLPVNLLSASCPGWVCYAEKTHGEWCLPYLAKTQSAQATMGKLLKSHWCDSKQLRPDQIYHCTVMSCFDKKLEAARPQFLSSDGSTPEVDACLTSVEMVSLIEQHLPKGKSFADYGQRPGLCWDKLDGGTTPLEPLSIVEGSSGGLLETIFRTAARELFDRSLPTGPLPMKTLRNANLKARSRPPSASDLAMFQEVSLEGEKGETLLRFASAYGFRNIQTLVQKIKRRQCSYDYIEVMACPSGCLNGGGQPSNREIHSAALLAKVQTAHQTDAEVRDPGNNVEIEPFMKIPLSTTYSKVQKSVHMDW